MDYETIRENRSLTIPLSDALNINPFRLSVKGTKLLTDIIIGGIRKAMKKPMVITFDLKEAKEQYGVKKLAEMCGVSRTTLYGLLSGRCSPSIPTLNKICNGLGVTPADLWRVR